MKRIKQAIIAAVLLASTAMTAQAAVSLKSSGDQWGPAVADLMNSNENGNWNESRFLSTFANRFNGTEEEAKALLSSLKAGTVPTSADSFNATLPATGGSGGGSTGGDYVTQPQRAADKADQAVTDKGQNTRIGQNEEDISELRSKTGDLQGQIGGVQSQAATEVNNRKAGDEKLQGQIDDHDGRITTAQSTADSAQTKANQAYGKAENAEGFAIMANGKVDQEVIDRKAADVVLDKKIDKNKADQAVRDEDQDTNIGKAQSTAEQALGVGTSAYEKASIADKKADNALTLGYDNKAAISKETDDRKAGDQALDAKITKNKADQAVRDAGQDEVIATKVDKTVFKADQDRQDAALASETNSRIAGDEYVNSRVDAANQNIAANRQALINTNKQVAQNTADIANHEQRIQGLERQTNARFANMDKRIDDNKQKADAAVAGVAAMANIPQVTESARFSLGAGVGTRGSQQAVAVGMSSRLSDSVVGKLSVANDTESQWTAGVGIAVQW